MKKEILFVHSAGPQGMGEGSSNLVAYLKNKLGSEYEVLYPIMPNPDEPNYKSWKTKLDKVLPVLGGEIILVGHSLGGSVLLKYLSEKKIRKTIAGLFLIATPYWGKKDRDIEEFVLKEDFASKLAMVKKFFIYHSSGDPVVPVEHANAYARKLPQATIRTLGGEEHEFNKGLPELLDDIKKLGS